MHFLCISLYMNAYVCTFLYKIYTYSCIYNYMLYLYIILCVIFIYIYYIYIKFLLWDVQGSYMSKDKTILYFLLISLKIFFTIFLI